MWLIKRIQWIKRHLFDDIFQFIFFDWKFDLWRCSIKCQKIEKKGSLQFPKWLIDKTIISLKFLLTLVHHTLHKLVLIITLLSVLHTSFTTVSSVGLRPHLTLPFFLFLSPDMTMIVGMTAAARTRATTSPSHSPSSPWAWANSSSPRLPPPRPPPQQTHSPVTLATACFPCHSAWAYVSIMTRAGCIFTTPTPWGAFTRGRWIAREQCIRLSASWAAARFNWKSLSPLRGWPSEEGWRVFMHNDLHPFNLWHVLGRAGFIDRVMEYNPNCYFWRSGEADVIMVLGPKCENGISASRDWPI